MDISIRALRNLLLGLVFIQIFAIPSSAMATVIVEDDLGREVEFSRPVHRVVSLYAAHTENVIALGAGETLVGVSRSDSPEIVGESVRRLPLRPGPEMLLALNPDLILMRSMQIKVHPEFLTELERLGLPVLVLDPPGWGDLPRYLDLLGAVLDRREQAKDLHERVGLILGQTRKRTETLRGEGPRPSVFLVAVGRKLYTCSPDSWAAHLIEAAGGRNVASGALPVSPGSGIARFGIEKLLALSDRLDLMLVQSGKMNDLTAEDIGGDPRLASLGCVRGGEVFDVEEKMLSRPSLLRIEDALNRLVEVFYGAGEA